MNDMQHKMEAFKKDLSGVFSKHLITLKEKTEAWHGGSEDVIEVYIDGEPYAWEDLAGILKAAGLLKEQTVAQ